MVKKKANIEVKKIKKQKKKTSPEEFCPAWLPEATLIEGRTWIPGCGPLAAETMFVIDRPSDDEARLKECMNGAYGAILKSFAIEAGVILNNCYFTYAVKFRPKGKNITAKEIKLCVPLLKEEISRIKPSLIVCFGKAALEAVTDKKYGLSDYRGTVLPYSLGSSIKVFPMYSPGYLKHNPNANSEFKQDWQMVARLQATGKLETDKTEVFVVTKYDELKDVIDNLLTPDTKELILALDCEWEGRTWMVEHGYIRTIQFTAHKGMAVVVELCDVQGRGVDIKHESDMLLLMGEFLTDPRVKLVGQNLVSDAEWLATYGINILNNMFYDTMYAEHTINPTGPFGLEVLTTKYTNLGRYDLPLVDWKNSNPKACDEGYGKIPRDILIPYGAADVDTLLQIMEAQKPLLKPFIEPRGEYISLWDAVMVTQRAVFELETTGMNVDKNQLNKLTAIYQAKLTELETAIKTMAATQFNLPEFNFKSPQQVAHVLFNVIKVTPIKTTSGKPWDWTLDQSDEVLAEINASTDKTTLAILQDEHPFIKLLMDARKIEHTCKTWLREDYNPEVHNEVTKGGGLLAKIWPDGRIHARFSPLKETARFSSSKPNMQNWPKKAEGDIARIFAGINPSEEDKKKIPDSLRTIIIPSEGHLLMESDWKQAELFVLAYLSNDTNMKAALTTPGKDLHDETTIKAFGFKVLTADGNPVNEQEILNIAKQDMKAFKKVQKSLIYVDQRGRKYSRDDFKEGPRVAGKNVGFGIPYGRGSLAIALQVKSETGTDKTINELAAEIQTIIDVWKQELYPSAWTYMMSCADAVIDPGYLVNPLGRIRTFPEAEDNKIISAMKREAQNWPIQSSVADLCFITFNLMFKERTKHNLHFKLINQIHDAILLDVPENEVDQTKELFKQTMGSIKMPLPDGNILELGIDLDVMPRWSDKED
ncbi:DNA polymerase [Verrucomicrobiota bacterium]